jgi:DNA-binding LacI/PurR family transcriptional regulator
MKQVAFAAGVSQAAVSYAYSRPSKLSPSQCEHIMATATELGYAGPSQVGASLRSGRTGAIGVMLMDSLSYAVSDPSTQALLSGIAAEPGFTNIDLTLIPMAGPTGSSGSAKDGTRGLVDGIIVHSLPDEHPALRSLQARGVPLVVVDAPLLPSVPKVTIPDRAAAMGLMAHVLEQGHREIGILVDRLVPDGRLGPVGPERMAVATERVVRERLKGFLAVTDAAGIAREDVHVREAGGFSTLDGVTAAARLLDDTAREGRELGVIVATSDVLALACLDVLEGRGVAVPGAVAVAGFDDAPEAARRGLTTVRQPLVTKGRVAARMLHQLLSGDTDVEDVEVPTELVVRRSTLGGAANAASQPTTKEHTT